MLDNLNWWEIGALLLLAMLIFGDKLPNAISDGLRMLRNLRQMASNATSDLSRELGTDIQLEDLHPKTLIRKHLLSEEDEEALRKPLQGVYDSLRGDLDGVRTEMKEMTTAADFRSSASTAIGGTNGSGAADGSGAAESSVPTQSPHHAFDVDAT